VVALPLNGVPDRIVQLRARWQNDPSSRIFLQLAEEYRHVGRVQEALAVLEAGLKEHPGYLSALVAKGRCLLELGDAGQARGVLERVVQQDATQMVANKLLVRAYLETGEPERAGQRLDLYTLLNDSDPEIEELRRRVVAMSRAPEVPDGPRTKEPAERSRMDRAETPESADAGPDVFDLVKPVQPIAAGLRPLGEGNGSEPFPDPDPAHSRALYLAGLEAEGIFHFGGLVAAAAVAEPAAAAAAEQTPPMATATLGELYRRQGHLDEAERIFREVMAREPGNDAARQALAELAITPGRVGSPLGETDITLRRPPQEPAGRRGDRPLDAGQLLAGMDQPQASVVARKAYLLQSYLARLRQARRPRPHVS
jgi:thioredoxin-like negative regulator of GroEL